MYFLCSAIFSVTIMYELLSTFCPLQVLCLGNWFPIQHPSQITFLLDVPQFSLIYVFFHDINMYIYIQNVCICLVHHFFNAKSKKHILSILILIYADNYLFYWYLHFLMIFAFYFFVKIAASFSIICLIW